MLLQGLLVEVLLVERPSELIESELVELGGVAQFDDARIGALGVAEASAREEVLAPPELHFVEVRGMRIRTNQALHCRDGLFGAAEFVVRPRHLRSEEHTSELQSRLHLVCRLLLEKKKNKCRIAEIFLARDDVFAVYRQDISQP